jgi:hypothetical protein
MAEEHSRRRAVTTRPGRRLQPIEVNRRPKTHYPFITKIQVQRIKKDETSCECDAQRTDRSPRTQLESLQPRNFTYKAPPATRAGSQGSLYDSEETIFAPRRESLEETRKRRRQMLGERASAMAAQNDNESLYRPQLSSEDCKVQLLLVRELTKHLESVGRETSARKQQRLPAFHSRVTKGERVFGVNKWK